MISTDILSLYKDLPIWAYLKTGGEGTQSLDFLQKKYTTGFEPKILHKKSVLIATIFTQKEAA